MYTMGREREKENLKGYSFYRAGLEPHHALIDAFHDWMEGKTSPADTLDRVFDVIDGKPTTAVLDTAGHWFRRAVEGEPRFKEFIDRLVAHKRANVRAAAALEMREPRSDEEHVLFQKLLADRSQLVRSTLVGQAEYGRWLSVVDALKAHAASLPDAKEAERVIEVCDFIADGYRRKGDFLYFYSGDAPGGAGSITSAPVDQYKLVPFDRISREELEYRRRKAVWPKRPPRYRFLTEVFAAWRPLSED